MENVAPPPGNTTAAEEDNSEMQTVQHTPKRTVDSDTSDSK